MQTKKAELMQLKIYLFILKAKALQRVIQGQKQGVLQLGIQIQKRTGKNTKSSTETQVLKVRQKNTLRHRNAKKSTTERAHIKAQAVQREG